MHTRGGERNAEAWWSAYTEGEGRVEGALTGSASAGIRALQILLVREPASGIGGEGARYFAALSSMLARRAFRGRFPA